jgi:hypothetical protein
VKCFDIKLSLPRGSKEARLALICCIHRGHKSHDEKRAIEWRDFILKDPSTFCMSLGDDTENAIPTDPKHASMMFDQVEDPVSQRMWISDYWLPVAKAKKLIVTHNSNHWARTDAITGESPARELNVFLQNQYDAKSPAESRPHPNKLPRWGNWQALTRLSVGRNQYVIHSWHGIGGAATPEGALRKCRSMAMQHRADIFAIGHYHQKIAWQDSYMEFSADGMEAKEKQRTFICTGGFLGWHDNYAERAGLPPNRRGGMLIRLGADKWDVKVGL